MSTPIALNGSATISLAAGQMLTVSGTGVATLGPGPQAGQPRGIQGSGTVGPFDRAQDVYLCATGTALNYDVGTLLGGLGLSSTGFEPNAMTAAQLQALKSSVQAVPRTLPLPVATFGDSTADTNGTTTNQGLLTQTFATAGTVSMPSPEKFLLTNSYSQAWLVGNGGIGGQTTAQMLARDTTASSATRKSIQDIIDLKPSVILLRAGGINDFAGMNAAQISAQIPLTYANHVEIISRFLIAGLQVIDSGIYGYSGSAYPDPVATRAAVVKLNSMYAAYAATLPGKVFFVSPVGVVSDSAGNFLPNCVLQDTLGVHLSWQGEAFHAQAEAAPIISLFGACSGPRYVGKNLMKSAPTAANGGNPLFASIAGNIPTGLNWGFANSASQVYGIEYIDGRKWATFTSTPSGAGHYIAPYFDLDAANFAPAVGDQEGYEFDFIVQSPTGGAPPLLTGMIAKLHMIQAVTGKDLSLNAHQLSQNSSFTQAYRGKAIWNPFQFPADTTTFTTAEMMAQFTSGDAVAPMTVKVSGARRVKLN